MEVVSPIVYRKIDLNKFEKVGHYNQIQTMFYDNISKKLVQISDQSIKIFNKSATNLKKDLNLKLQREKINKIAVDKHIRYMLVLLENRMSLVVNLKTEKVNDILHYDFSSLHGMFFIHNSQTLTIMPKEDVKFCFVFPNKIVYFNITQGQGMVNDSIKEVKNVKMSGSSIVQFHYNQRYMILVTEKSDKTFDFYNLSSEKYFSKSHNFKYPSKSSNVNTHRESSLSKFLGIFKKTKEIEEYTDREILEKKDILYKKTHFFLETLYKKLYFICLNYEDAEIQIFHVSSLINITKVTTITFENSQISTLQFIDNIILLHNFERCDTIAIDLKSDNPEKIIFKNFPMTNHQILAQNKLLCSDLINVELNLKDIPDDSLMKEKNDGYEIGMKLNYNYIETTSMLSYNNRIFYEKNIVINGGVIEERDPKGQGNIIYDVYFDPLIYYENITLKHEAVFNLIRRKNSKDVIIHALYEMIKSGNSIKIIKIIFNKISKQLQKNLHNTQSIGISTQLTTLPKNARGTISNFPFLTETENSTKTSTDLPTPTQFIILRKKTIVKQSDMYYNLFKAFERKHHVKPDYIVKILVHFVNSLMSYHIPIQPSFHVILIDFLKKIPNFSFHAIFLQYHSIPDSIEMAKYLVDEVSTSPSGDPCAFQLGLDMLMRLKKYDEAFVALIKKKRLLDALTFCNRYNIKIDSLSSENLRVLKMLSEEKKEITVQFVNKN